MIRRVFLVLFLGLLISGAAQAQTPQPTVTTRSQSNSGYPTRSDLYVNDLANVISSNDERDLREIVRKIGYDFNMTIITIGGVVDYDPTEPTIETFSTNLFNRWAIGDKVQNRGVLIVLAIRNRDVRIELGEGYAAEYNDDMKAVIEEYMIPRFREGNYAEGLSDGAVQIYRELIGRLPTWYTSSSSTAATAVPVSTRRPSTNSNSTIYSDYDTSSRNGSGLLGLAAGAAGVVGVGGAGALVLRETLRRRPRRCASCGTMMVRLDEVADDAHLDEGQRMEEMLGSVHHDVWECPSCQARAWYDYGAWFSGFSPCPQCGYRTTSRTSTVLDHATQYSTGLRLVETNCQHCNYHQEWEEVIPMVSRSSSSSSGGSSFSGGGGGGGGGGGSSSGGGASGSW